MTFFTFKGQHFLVFKGLIKQKQSIRARFIKGPGLHPTSDMSPPRRGWSVRKAQLATDITMIGSFHNQTSVCRRAQHLGRFRRFRSNSRIAINQIRRYMTTHLFNTIDVSDMSLSAFLIVNIRHRKTHDGKGAVICRLKFSILVFRIGRLLNKNEIANSQRGFFDFVTRIILSSIHLLINKIVFNSLLTSLFQSNEPIIIIIRVIDFRFEVEKWHLGIHAKHKRERTLLCGLRD